VVIRPELGLPRKNAEQIEKEKGGLGGEGIGDIIKPKDRKKKSAGVERKEDTSGTVPDIHLPRRSPEGYKTRLRWLK